MEDEKKNKLKRKHFIKAEGRPFLFYVIFGYNLPITINESDLPTYKISKEMEEEMEMVHYNSEEHLEYINTFRSGSIWEQLQLDDKEFSEQIADCEECIIIIEDLEDRDNFAYMKNTIGVITYIMNNGGVAIYDMEKIGWWKLSEWTNQVFNSEEINPNQHVIILCSKEDNGESWYHTRGLRKFGRPDLSIHKVDINYRDAVIDLFNRFISYLGHGGTIKDYQEIRLDSLPNRIWCLNKGDLEDLDFNNKHIELNWK